MTIEIILLLFVLVILYCLGTGVFYLVRAGSDPAKLAKALTWRVALSFTLFALLFVSYYFGWLKPAISANLLHIN